MHIFQFLFQSLMCLFLTYFLLILFTNVLEYIKTYYRLRLESFPRSVSSSIFCMDLLSAFNNARFKFQGSGSNTLEVMSICLNHIKLKKVWANLWTFFENMADSEFQLSPNFLKKSKGFEKIQKPCALIVVTLFHRIKEIPLKYSHLFY